MTIPQKMYKRILLVHDLLDKDTVKKIISELKEFYSNSDIIYHSVKLDVSVDNLESYFNLIVEEYDLIIYCIPDIFNKEYSTIEWDQKVDLDKHCYHDLIYNNKLEDILDEELVFGELGDIVLGNASEISMRIAKDSLSYFNNLKGDKFILLYGNVIDRLIKYDESKHLIFDYSSIRFKFNDLPSIKTSLSLESYLVIEHLTNLAKAKEAEINKINAKQAKEEFNKYIDDICSISNNLLTI